MGDGQTEGRGDAEKERALILQFNRLPLAVPSPCLPSPVRLSFNFQEVQ
jgi:hypothetical protein